MTTTRHTDPASRESLSPARVIDEALAVAEEAGVKAVTIRGVARRLGVTPMALYWHFRNKDDLLDGMVARLFGAVNLSLDDSTSWQEQLRALLDAELAVLRRHPQSAILLLTRSSTTNEALQVIETALAILHRAGLSASEATQVMRHAQQTVIGLVAQEPRLSPDDQGDDAERRAQAILKSLSPGHFPHVIAASEFLSSCADPDAYYAFGVDLLMAGIEAMANRRS